MDNAWHGKQIGTGKRYRNSLQVKFPGPGKYETNKDENTGMSMVKIMNKTCGFAKRWNKR
jgi:NOL1/NOP2/fmu family ribosome biogenesis protein